LHALDLVGMLLLLLLLIAQGLLQQVAQFWRSSRTDCRNSGTVACSRSARATWLLNGLPSMVRSR